MNPRAPDRAPPNFSGLLHTILKTSTALGGIGTVLLTPAQGLMSLLQGIAVAATIFGVGKLGHAAGQIGGWALGETIDTCVHAFNERAKRNAVIPVLAATLGLGAGIYTGGKLSYSIATNPGQARQTLQNWAKVPGTLVGMWDKAQNKIDNGYAPYRGKTDKPAPAANKGPDGGTTP